MAKGVGSETGQAWFENELWGWCGGTWEVSMWQKPRCSEDTEREAWHTASGQPHTGVLVSRGDGKGTWVGGAFQDPPLLSKYSSSVVTMSFKK